jgi:branched-subunit amino acid ABC-type transport system permease component
VLEAVVGAQISAQSQSVAVFAAVLLVLLFRPRGIFGETAAA